MTFSAASAGWASGQRPVRPVSAALALVNYSTKPAAVWCTRCRSPSDGDRRGRSIVVLGNPNEGFFRPVERPTSGSRISRRHLEERVSRR